jgi:hypothetical protein
MAVYKVPQDVEADDKLIGPFSFRQFIYVIIAIIGIALGWGLSQLFIPLAIIPLPIIIFFGALALPLRKDQPMEIYLAAVVSFYLKPRKRLWQPDGIQSLVEITAPKVVEIHRSKDLSQTEAERRLSYLADIVDTEGWAVRGVNVPSPNSAMQNDAFFEAQQTEDVLDESGGIAQSFETMIGQSDAKRRQEMVNKMHNPAPAAPIAAPAPSIPDPYAALTPSVQAPQADDPHLTYNPYPNSIHQAVINPIGSEPIVQPQPVVAAQPAATPAQLVIPNLPAEWTNPPANTSENVISPDIINLANNSDLSIETIAHEANRIHQKEEKLPEDEVVISLR